jgi:hypothetical protein
MNKYKQQDLRKFIESIPQEEVNRQTKLQDDENRRVYDEFRNALKIGMCSFCGHKMDTFDTENPCFHWFTYPTAIRKKHFEIYLKNPIGYFQFECYLRWLANTEQFIGNINDLKDETSKTSYIETTIKYKNIEWAFSIGHTDKDGHPNSKIGSEPHYHIQMIVDDRIFLKFNDFHIPFSDGDLFTMELLEQAGDKVKLGHSFGEGISVLEDIENIDILDEALQISDDYDNAPFNRQTLIIAPEGQTISGEMIQLAIKESNKTKQPIGKIMQRLLKNANITTILAPGDGIPEMTKRSGKK